MRLSQADVQEFQDIWRREFDDAISADRAEDEARRLIELYTVLARNLGDRDASQIK